MVTKRVRCPHCASLRTKKGTQNKKQRYRCGDCGRRFQIKRENKKLSSEMRAAYAREKQTLEELANRYGKRHVWVRKQLDSIEMPVPDTEPQVTVIIADTT